MTMMRLPHEGSRWVWEIDDADQRNIIEVKEVRFNGEEWDVTTLTLPDAPIRSSLPQLDPPIEERHNLDRFWWHVTPIDGKLEDLSHEISPQQYKRS